ncbi:MAG: SDR family NAD(P)-dependent oxidoreductase [Nocardioides sp.]|uniref:SDR family NAD(P)-dependent oxidoreductase n=1 Tax=Nocardioides sp. TaxID=35761 RepID=UPI003EFEA0A0
MPFPLPDVSSHALDDLLSLRGRTSVVTGGAQGLGRAVAERLAEAGADVVLADLRLETADAAAREVSERYGVRALAVETDVTQDASVVALADRVVSELGSIDVWVNSAGIFPAVPSVEMPVEQWDQVFAVNTRGTFLGSREAARRMTTGGAIVNVVSTAGFQSPGPGLAAYVSSKHAVRGMTKAMAQEFAPLGIRVLGVAPTFVPTEGNIAMMEEAFAAAGMSKDDLPPMEVMNQSMIGRIGTPDDIARVVLFAASDMAMIMTGSVLLADAGETI